MALSGTISKKIGTGNVYTEWLDWKVNSQNISANTSNITVTLKAARTDGLPGYGAYNNYANNTIRLTVGGSVKSETTRANIDLRTSTGATLATWTGDVSHNADGSLNLALEGYFYFNSTAASSLPRNGYTVSGTAAINTIPRKSTVTCTDALVGSAATIIINRASSSFTHTLTYSFGNLSGTIASKTAEATIGWALPVSFYAQMPNTKIKTGTIICETFNGNISLGTNSCSFTATAVSTVAVSGSVTDINEATTTLTGDSSKLVKFMSTVKAAIVATTNNSATITAKSINGSAVSAEKIFANCEMNSFVFSATDSRGYSNSQTVTASMVPYIKLTSNSGVTRDTPTGDTITLAIKGNYFNGNFGVADNTLSITYKYRLEESTAWYFGTITPVLDGNTYSATVNLSDFDYQKSYIFEITAADKLDTVTTTVKVLMGIPVFDWGKNDFNINVPLKAQGMTVSGTFNRGSWGVPTRGAVTQILDDSSGQHSALVGVTQTGERWYGIDLLDTTSGTAAPTMRIQAGENILGIGSVLSYNGKIIPDMEKGTWVPSLDTYTGSIAPTASYSIQQGYYAKIGSVVTIGLYLTGTITSVGDGYAAISGLPFIQNQIRYWPVTVGMTGGTNSDGNAYIDWSKITLRVGIDGRGAARFVAGPFVFLMSATYLTA